MGTCFWPAAFVVEAPDSLCGAPARTLRCQEATGLKSPTTLPGALLRSCNVPDVALRLQSLQTRVAAPKAASKLSNVDTRRFRTTFIIEEQSMPQTEQPHIRQWCRRVKKPNSTPHFEQESSIAKVGDWPFASLEIELFMGVVGGKESKFTSSKSCWAPAISVSSESPALKVGAEDGGGSAASVAV